MKKPGRNDPCPCGSGKKYKQCCGQLAEVATVMSHSVDASIPQAIRAALDYHKTGQFAQAEAMYRQILQAVPDQPDALHYLGLIAHNTGRNEIAVQLISRAMCCCSLNDDGC